MPSKSKIFIISGPSGAGKSSVTAPLRSMTDKFIFSVSCTTRPPRGPEEISGRDYYFISNQEFDELIAKGEFLEWEKIHQYRYGTRKKDFENLLDSDKTVIMVIDVLGAMNVKKTYPQAKTIFIIAPSLKEVAKRLALRGTEDKNSLEIRKMRYEKELKYKDKYDFVIVNDNLLLAQNNLLRLLQH